MTLPDNFWAKTQTTDCIVWTGACNSKGYPCFGVGGFSRLAHRLVWEDANGPIPDAMTIDHLCRVRSCVNIAHLELVTVAENNRRKRVAGGIQIGGQCARGHDITEVSAYRHPRGHLECKTCRTQTRADRAARAPRTEPLPPVPRSRPCSASSLP